MTLYVFIKIAYFWAHIKVLRNFFLKLCGIVSDKSVRMANRVVLSDPTPLKKTYSSIEAYDGTYI